MSRIARHTEIANDIEKSVREGTLTSIPTQRSLVLHYKTSSRTIQTVYDTLVSRGVIYTIPGRGAFIKKEGK